MNICYCDETGIGQNDFAVMCGIIADDQRMHKTKAHWWELLQQLRDEAKKPVDEIHTRDFYSGNGGWSKVKGERRAEIITDLLAWLKSRNHKAVIVCVEKPKYDTANIDLSPASASSPVIKPNSPWRYLGLHLVLAVQKYQRQKKNRLNGHTVMVFDNEESEKDAFSELIFSPPEWTNGYYKKDSEPLDMIVDVPYFANSPCIPLIQAADILCYLCRKYLLVASKIQKEGYPDELETLEGYMDAIRSISVKSKYTYPDLSSADDSAKVFYKNAPKLFLDRMRKT